MSKKPSEVSDALWEAEQYRAGVSVDGDAENQRRRNHMSTVAEGSEEVNPRSIWAFVVIGFLALMCVLAAAAIVTFNINDIFALF